MLYESTIEIERPIDDVFDATTCMRRCVVWNNTVSSQMDSEEPAHVGSTFSWEYGFLNMTYSFKFVITELDAPHTFAFKSIEGLDSSPVRYTFTPTESGTMFHLAAEIDELPAPIPLILNNGVAKETIEHTFQGNMNKLKSLLEGDVDLWTLTPPLPST